MKSQKKPLIILLTAALGIAAQAANAESVLRRGNGSEPQTLDPQTAQGVPESNILRDLFEGLIGEDASGNLPPARRQMERRQPAHRARLRLRLAARG